MNWCWQGSTRVLASAILFYIVQVTVGVTFKQGFTKDNRNTDLNRIFRIFALRRWRSPGIRDYGGRGS